MDKENQNQLSEKLLALVFVLVLFIMVWKTAPDRNFSEQNYFPAKNVKVQTEASVLPSLNIQKNQLEKSQTPKPDINAQSAASYLFHSDGEKIVLFEKNSTLKRPIASISKLMTAFLVFENTNLNDNIRIIPEAIAQDGDQIHLVNGEILTVLDLTKAMLIPSSNDAAYALSNYVGGVVFTKMMNEKAKEIGLVNTYFSNSHGLMSENKDRPSNYSTAQDLSKLVLAIYKKFPQILEITRIQKTEIFSVDKKFQHHLKNTNDLLGEIPEIIGGKTGFTDEAGETFLTMIKKSKNQGDRENNIIVNVILGTSNRTDEMRKLINWSLKYYASF
ncbi:MAG: D-alanyl-D-alanine carboxypeptidase [Parcubacteria group bacterium]|nr:D-alanyl-D-alanine carboxypeptidase [Parcubacteria group bacterium]